jgi:hypothetical protein
MRGNSGGRPRSDLWAHIGGNALPVRDLARRFHALRVQDGRGDRGLHPPHGADPMSSSFAFARVPVPRRPAPAAPVPPPAEVRAAEHDGLWYCVHAEGAPGSVAGDLSRIQAGGQPCFRSGHRPH